MILEQVGRGSMSRVYKAKHRTMNRPVAIKVLSSELTRTAHERQAFQAGVRTAGRLAHPNIVTAYDATELHDRFYLVLEFVNGPNLDAFVRQFGPLPVAEACEFVRQTADPGFSTRTKRGWFTATSSPRTCWSRARRRPRHSR